MINAFELKNGRLRQVPIENKQEFAESNPIWIDFDDPTDEERQWAREVFQLTLPDEDDFGDIEASARFFKTDDGAIHIRSDFILDLEDEGSLNIPVAFILRDDKLFSLHEQDLPVFRLFRMRARHQTGYVETSLDVLLDLYATDAEYSADALEGVYEKLEEISRDVLHSQLDDKAAAVVLSSIAREEDLNGRIRRNVMDTRRAVSFLMRSHLLSNEQLEDARQLLRDIESLDGHTSFLFDKINFLMDATVGFININQNKSVSQLTTLSVVFMPINVLAGIGGMSEFSMMTKDIPWPIAYSGFIVGMISVGLLTFLMLKVFEKMRTKTTLAAVRNHHKEGT